MVIQFTHGFRIKAHDTKTVANKQSLALRTSIPVDLLRKRFSAPNEKTGMTGV